MEFKDRLKNLRQTKNITQQELAKTIFVSRSAIAKWENGLGIPSDENLKSLCEFFEVDENWFLDKQDLKEEIKLNKLQKQNVIISIFGLMLPTIFILFSVAPLYHFYYEPGQIHPMVYWSPCSMTDFIGLWGIVGYLIWVATEIFSALSLCVTRLKKFPVHCFWINCVLLILSVLVFIVMVAISIGLAGQINYRLLF